eukprot:XP_011665347.1 PREDICTED: uncharacterized protein LOC105438793 [Strongylocentrotus purpuratus]
MADQFLEDHTSCDECGEKWKSVTDGNEPNARYLTRRKLCSECARGKCADSIMDSPSSSSVSSMRCREHRHRDVFLYCIKCCQPICDVCVHLTHSGHEYEDINKVVEERRRSTRQLLDKIVDKDKELLFDRRHIDECVDAVNERFKRLIYAVLVRVEERSRSINDDYCVSARKIENRAKDEKLKIDRWKDNRLREIKEERDAESREIKQRQCVMMQELDDVKQKLLSQIEEIREGLDTADEIIMEAKGITERTLTYGSEELLQMDAPVTSNSRLKECMELELDEDMINTVKAIAESVKFEPEKSDVERTNLLGRFVTTAPAWCKEHTIQVGLPQFRLLNATTDTNRVTFTGENSDDNYSLYTMNVENGSTNLITSDKYCITDSSPIDVDLMAVCRKGRTAIEVWNTQLGKVKRQIKVPRSWTHTCLTVDHDSMIIARDHSNTHGKLNVYRSDNGDKVRSIPYNGTIYSLHALSTGHLVIQSAATELVIINGIGATRATINHEIWQWVRCAVASDDSIIVAYGRIDDPSAIYVDAYSSTGEFVEHVTKHRCRPSLDHIAVVVTRSGKIVLQNGGDVVIYDRLIPLIPVATPVRSTDVISRLSTSSPPRSPTRRTIFMCIPT